MKRLTIAIIALAVAGMVTSCGGGEKCPTYGSKQLDNQEVKA